MVLNRLIVKYNDQFSASNATTGYTRHVLVLKTMEKRSHIRQLLNAASARKNRKILIDSKK